jgi:hypothetical protein
MILLALAHLAVERPGWEHILSETAKKMDNVQGQMSVKTLHLQALKGSGSDIKVENGKPIMFEQLRILHQGETAFVMNYVKTIVSAASKLEAFIPSLRAALEEERSAPSPGAPQG